MFVVADRGEHEGHRVIDALNAAVGAGMVRACGIFVDAEAFVEGAGEFGAELKAIVRLDGSRVPPERDVAVD